MADSSQHTSQPTPSSQPAGPTPSQPTSQTIPQRRTRGPTICRKLKKKKVEENLTVEFDEFNRPIGPNAKTFRSFIGTVVRCNIDINIIDWHHVDQGLKDVILEDIKKEFNITDDSMKAHILRTGGLRWKDFKGRLFRDFIKKKNPKYESPTQCYDFLSED